MSLMVKNCFSVIEMTFMCDADALKGHIYICLFGHQTANTKCIWPNLAGKRAVPNWGIFHHVVVVRFVPEFVFPTQVVP